MPGTRKLGKATDARMAMLRQQVTDFLDRGRMETTVTRAKEIAPMAEKMITLGKAKAKALRKYVEPLITKSKEDTTHSRRVVFSNLQDKFAVTELFKEISVKVADRPGGYTRIIKLGTRRGDAAEVAVIELV